MAQHLRWPQLLSSLLPFYLSPSLPSLPLPFLPVFTVIPQPPAESPEQQPEEREEEEGTGSDEDAVQIDWGDLSHSDSTDLATGQQSGMELEGGVMETIEWDGLETLDVSEIMIEESGEGGGEKEEEEGGERMGETAVVEDGESGACK